MRFRSRRSRSRTATSFGVDGEHGGFGAQGMHEGGNANGHDQDLDGSPVFGLVDGVRVGDGLGGVTVVAEVVVVVVVEVLVAST